MRYLIIPNKEKMKVLSVCTEFNETTTCSSAGGVGSGNYVSIEVGV